MAVPRSTETRNNMQTNDRYSGTTSRRAFSASVFGTASSFLVRSREDEAKAEWWNPFEYCIANLYSVMWIDTKYATIVIFDDLEI